MAKSKTETGDHVYAANFSRIIKICVEAGLKYKPPDTSISVANLTLKETSILTAIDDFREAAGPWRIAVDKLQGDLEPVNKLITRVVNEVKACDVTKQFIDDVVSAAKKIKGIRINMKVIPTAPADPNSPSDKSIHQISVAQTGIDNKISHIEDLIELLTNEPNYNPSEDELKIAALQTLVDDLKSKRDDVDTTKPHLDAKRIAKNDVMYHGPKCGSILCGKVKSYFKALYGAKSKEYHDIAKIKFPKLQKKYDV